MFKDRNQQDGEERQVDTERFWSIEREREYQRERGRDTDKETLDLEPS